LTTKIEGCIDIGIFHVRKKPFHCCVCIHISSGVESFLATVSRKSHPFELLRNFFVGQK